MRQASQSTGGKYPIRAVSRLTGIPVDTLRAWERRHRAVEPGRDERGRLYGEAEVRKLTLLRRLVERGHAIGRIAGLGNAELERLLEAGLEPAQRTSRLDVIDVADILACIDAYDLPAMERRIGRLAAVLSSRELVHQVVLPVLRQVGDGWLHGRFRTSQEHLASAAMRNLLGAILRVQSPRDAAGALVLATPEGERHEFGILAAAMVAASAGVGTVYLGPDLPAEDVAEAALRTGARAVAVGLTRTEGEPSPVAGALALAERVPRGVIVLAGGAAAMASEAELRRGGVAVIPDLDALEVTLRGMR